MANILSPRESGRYLSHWLAVYVGITVAFPFMVIIVVALINGTFAAIGILAAAVSSVSADDIRSSRDLALMLNGLLHLVAINFATSVAYLAMRGRQYDVSASSIFNANKPLGHVGEVLDRLDVRPYDRVQLYPVSMLCYVADVPIKSDPWTRYVHFLRRQIDFPMLNYFRRKRDLIVVGIVAATHIALLFLLTASTIWPLGLVQNVIVVQWIYSLTLVSTLWLALSMGALWRLQFLPDKLHALEADITSYFERVAGSTTSIERRQEGS